MLWALVPAKLGATAKERLKPALSAELRAELARSMLSDVLDALRRVELVSRIALISRDPDALQLAQRAGATPLLETVRGDLNQAVAEGVGRCIALGASAVMITMGDIPLVSSLELTRVAESLPSRGIVVTPSLDGTGTNVMAVRPPDLMPTRFGPGSLERHLALAGSLGLEVVTCQAPGAALDVDTLEDLLGVLRRDDRSIATARLMQEARRRGEWHEALE